MKNKTTLITVSIAVIALGAGFGGGYAFKNYQLQKSRGNFMTFGANGAQRFVGNRMGGQANGMFRGGATTGEVISMDDKSITVKMIDGITKIVLFATSTTYSNTVTATKTDVKTGSTVAVFGTPNSDGSITATNVQINPMFGRVVPSPTQASK